MEVRRHNHALEPTPRSVRYAPASGRGSPRAFGSPCDMGTLEMLTKTETLDRWLGTFTKDLEFCESLAISHASAVGRLLVYVRWAQLYFSPIQEELYGMAAKHFPSEQSKTAGIWTLALTGGVTRDIRLVPYLVVRGLISEAGLAVRRSMENVGVLAHLWQEPDNATYLSTPDAPEFRRAFMWESDKKKNAVLKAKGIQKRFEHCVMAQPLSQLYQILSAYTVHGGSPEQLIGAELVPTRLSCSLVNRPDPLERDISRDLQLLGNGCEMLCIELCAVHGTFGKKYGVTPSKGDEGGFYLTKLLDGGPESEMAKVIRLILSDLGWLEKQRPSE